MAVSKSPTQITFSGANSILVSGDSQVTSDNMAFSSNSVAAQITLYADHSGTPVTGDTVDFYILYSTGDLDGSGTATYDTPGHGLHLTNLDLNTDLVASYIAEVPVDPDSACDDTDTCYEVCVTAAGRITVQAPNVETRETISVTR